MFSPLLRDKMSRNGEGQPFMGDEGFSQRWSQQVVVPDPDGAVGTGVHILGSAETEPLT
jgi:hypothetical protein